MSDLENEEPPLTPSAERVARRSLVLAAVTCRADIEGDPEAEEFRSQVLDWARTQGLDDELEPQELRLLSAPVGTLGRQEWIDAGWRSEGLGILAWALGGSLPTYDQQVVAAEVAMPLGFLASNPAILEKPSLRPVAELETFARQMFALHWRLRELSLSRSPLDFVEFAAKAWFGPLDLGGLRIIEGDLAIRDEPVFRSKLIGMATSIAQERHLAANWLLGFDPEYSAVDTST